MGRSFYSVVGPGRKAGTGTQQQRATHTYAYAGKRRRDKKRRGEKRISWNSLPLSSPLQEPTNPPPPPLTLHWRRTAPILPPPPPSSAPNSGPNSVRGGGGGGFLGASAFPPPPHPPKIYFASVERIPGKFVRVFLLSVLRCYCSRFCSPNGKGKKCKRGEEKKKGFLRLTGRAHLRRRWRVACAVCDEFSGGSRLAYTGCSLL